MKPQTPNPRWTDGDGGVWKLGGTYAWWILVLALVGFAAAGLAFCDQLAENERHYEYELDPGELSASGNMRWTVSSDSSEATVWMRTEASRDMWAHKLEHDSNGRVVFWSVRQGSRSAEWRYTDGECTLTTPEGVQTVQGCEPLPHPLLQTVDCWEADCSYAAPDLRFTALETRVWQRGADGTTASGRNMRSVIGSNGEVWWYASGDHSPDYMTMLGGLTWNRVGAPAIAEQLRQPSALSGSGDTPNIRSVDGATTDVIAPEPDAGQQVGR